MKRTYFPLVLLICLIAACQQPAQTEKKETPAPAAATKEATPDFSGIQFASKKDLACGMPLTAGVGDTAQVNGKIYGFCSKECKDEFLKNPSAYIAKAEK
ncbi:MAG TPA: YHS domain-containing protein [Puia sp.]|nr:YHS domain-containing protein [Puia sp.]